MPPPRPRPHPSNPAGLNFRLLCTNHGCPPIRPPMQVRGKDDVGAKMDSMELEREKGKITSTLFWDHFGRPELLPRTHVHNERALFS